MAIKYGFFNSVNGDRKYNADDISNKVDFGRRFPEHRRQTCRSLESSGMKVNVSAGSGVRTFVILHMNH